MPEPSPRRPTDPSPLDEALARLGEHPGVEHVILLGRDGLVVQHGGAGRAEEEAIAARVPTLAAACDRLGASALSGDFLTAVIEYAQGVAIVVSLSSDLLLTVLVERDVGFAPLLREARRERSRLIELL